MTPHLTKPNAELSRLIARTPEGMMFWSGTRGDPSATCSGCKYFGFTEVIRNGAGNEIDSVGHPSKCELYFRHIGKPSKKPIRPDTAACKYFEAKRRS